MTYSNNQARKEVKLLKAINDITYLEFAEMAGLNKNSMYCWISGQYNLGEDKLDEVSELIMNLKGE